MALMRKPRTRVKKARVNLHHEGMKKLWAATANLPDPPRVFEADKIYRVKLTKAVKPTDHSFHLRPDQDVQVSGRVAEEIRDFISGAVMVG